jgi:hypothetical protein
MRAHLITDDGMLCSWDGDVAGLTASSYHNIARLNTAAAATAAAAAVAGESLAQHASLKQPGIAESLQASRSLGPYGTICSACGSHMQLRQLL